MLLLIVYGLGIGFVVWMLGSFVGILPSLVVLAAGSVVGLMLVGHVKIMSNRQIGSARRWVNRG